MEIESAVSSLGGHRTPDEFAVCVGFGRKSIPQELKPPLCSGLARPKAEALGYLDAKSTATAEAAYSDDANAGQRKCKCKATANARPVQIGAQCKCKAKVEANARPLPIQGQANARMEIQTEASLR
jgi:hypothetical protein